MTLLVIFIVLSLVGFIIYAYSILSNKVTQINFAKDRLDQQLDVRFKVYENLIQDVKKITIYENTILKDVAHYRMQAQNFKIKNNIKSQLQIESKISKLSENITVFFTKYNLEGKIKNIDFYQSEMDLNEKKINDLKKELNDAIKEYNSIRELIIFKLSYFVFSYLKFKKIDNQLHIWK